VYQFDQLGTVAFTVDDDRGHWDLVSGERVQVIRTRPLVRDRVCCVTRVAGNAHDPLPASCQEEAL
jgi:hypothetical protein